MYILRVSRRQNDLLWWQINTILISLSSKDIILKISGPGAAAVELWVSAFSHQKKRQTTASHHLRDFIAQHLTLGVSRLHSWICRRLLTFYDFREWLTSGILRCNRRCLYILHSSAPRTSLVNRTNQRLFLHEKMITLTLFLFHPPQNKLKTKKA